MVATPPRRVGKSGDHLQLTVKQDRQSIRCIAFQCGDLIDRLSPNTAVRLAVEPCINEFNGRKSVELEVKDFQFTGEGETAEHIGGEMESAGLESNMTGE
jgi:single-stranded-DNA-specific exonuclease